MKKHKCPCGINCISYAICKHKTFDGLLHECSEVYDFLHPRDLMDNNRCRILDKSLQSTEWEVKILGGKNVYEVVRERYRNPRRPGRTLEKQWVWLRIIDIQYDVNLKEARIFDER